MKPKIIFHHAKLLEPFFEVYTLQKQPDYVEPPLEDFLKVLDEHKEKWKVIEKKFLKSISKTFKMSFKRKILDAYIVRGARMSMSKPLIIKFSYDSDLMIYSLMHELVHIFLVGNNVKELDFKGESSTTINHIHLFAFIEKFYKEVLKDEETLNKIKALSKDVNYKRAWEIVGREGYSHLIQKLVKENKKIRLPF